MTPFKFVDQLSQVNLPNVFNPYADICLVHDLSNAPLIRRHNLANLLTSAQQIGVDTVWMGRDLGYRGGRRTGLALTDERHLPMMGRVYPGSEFCRSTIGPEIAERTAAEIWSVVAMLNKPPLLWNVFPYHPHDAGSPFTNRRFSARELKAVDELNAELISWLRIRRVISIGQDASNYAIKFGVEVERVRHPSYGGVSEFREGMSRLYGLDVRKHSLAFDQTKLF